MRCVQNSPYILHLYPAIGHILQLYLNRIVVERIVDVEAAVLDYQNLDAVTDLYFVPRQKLLQKGLFMVDMGKLVVLAYFVLALVTEPGQFFSPAQPFFVLGIVLIIDKNCEQ